MTEKKLPNGLKLVFAPGCFDHFEGTQEELDELIKEIEQSFSDGTFLEKSTPVDLDPESLEEMDEEELLALEQLINMIEGNDEPRKLQ